MYFVDRSIIERHLLYMDGLMNEFDQHSYDSFLEKLSLERMTHMVIESMLDVGNMVIDGFIMRDPGSFSDIIDILVDETVLPAEEADGYKQVIELRKMLVKDYLNIDHEEILRVMKTNYASIEMFSSRINDFLDNETGVANTFSGN
ncbi:MULTISPECIES: DUF86 domain-containing protein [Sediminibacillus]|uniref:Uncharacterized conserved protein YutE, UPF0331/DUF86 family n=2 Tax=Sediminibacillus TaxID=482460 RepID=A0A1G9QSV2_9BACI|nr:MULTISPECIES: DUF86 domain-containing protein [Sediminibacillus]QTN00203.1 DUF86 domain-containing protein [Sediminibacillus dalangtanensis]SDM13941.1 Uncharacterized conserved protein YutE, UPF0331/DUF86 family [Sediminibacillus halophilus]